MATKLTRASFFIRGIASYPKLNKPHKWSDAQNKSVPDPDGEYETGLIVSAEAAARHIDATKKWVKENNLKVKKLPWRPEVDKETDEETGNITFSAKQYAKDKDGKPRKIPMVDAAGNPLPKDFFLTGGSEVVLKVRPSHYKAQGGGVKFYLDGVQVIKYVEYDRDLGFEKQDGFTYGGDQADEDDFDSADDDSDNGTDEDDTDF